VLLLGVAYKRDIDDVRESPALDILKLLEADGAEVAYHDPFIPVLKEDDRELKSVELTDKALKEADAVVIVTDHTVIDYQRVLRLSKVLVDARHVVPRTAGDAVPTGVDRWIVKA